MTVHDYDPAVVYDLHDSLRGAKGSPAQPAALEELGAYARARVTGAATLRLPVLAREDRRP